MKTCKICKKWLAQSDGICWLCHLKNHIKEKEQENAQLELNLEENHTKTMQQ